MSFNEPLDTGPPEGVSRAGAGAHGIEIGAGPKRAVMVPSALPGGPSSPSALSTAEGFALSGASAAGLPLRRVEIDDDLPITAEGFRSLLAAAYQVYLEEDTGLPPPANKIAVVADVSINLTRRVLESRSFRTACKLRGIATSVKEALTPEQDILLQTLSDPTIKGGLSARLKKAGVSFSKYRAWAKQPLFRNRLNQLSDGILKETEGAMMTSLAERAVDGDLNSIKFAFEVSGRHDPAKQEQANVRAVVAQIIEILQQEISDPDILNRIGLRMQGAVLNSTPTNRQLER